VVLSRLRKHIPSHDWFAVGVELLIVVVGVFIGLQVSNWNDLRSARREGHAYRARIVEDIRFDEASMQRRINYYSRVRQFGEAALAALEQPPGATDGEQFLIDAFQATQIAPGLTNRITYDEAISAGALDMIGDVSLRRKLATYYLTASLSEAVNLTTVPPYRDVMRRSMPYAVQQSIRTRCAEVFNASPQDANTRLPSTCSLGLTSSTIEEAVTEVRSVPELRQELTMLLSDIDQKLILFAASRDRARKLAQEIEAGRA